MTPDQKLNLETKVAIKVCLEFASSVESYINKDNFTVGLGFKDKTFAFHLYLKNKKDMKLTTIPNSYNEYPVLVSYVGIVKPLNISEN